MTDTELDGPDIWDQISGPVVNSSRVQRNGLDQPYVFAPDYAGEINFERKTIKGRSGYTRTTTFVDCLDDKSAIAVYNMRNVLRGLVARPLLMMQVRDAVKMGHHDEPDVKAALNMIVARAREAAYEDEKADRGTFVHGLAEDVDLAIEGGMTPAEALRSLVDTVFLGTDHREDVAAYLRLTRPLLRPILIEALTIVDKLKTAGTPDRLCEWIGPRTEIVDSKGNVLAVIEPGDIVVVDLKTGSLEFGVGKFAMQLGIYANGQLYDQHTNTRTDLPERIRKDWGLIVHLPAGSARPVLVWIDIKTGYSTATTLATKVRAWRNTSKKLTVAHPEPTLLQQVQGAITADEVRALWSAHRIEWNDELTEIGKAKP